MIKLYIRVGYSLGLVSVSYGALMKKTFIYKCSLTYGRVTSQ